MNAPLKLCINSFHYDDKKTEQFKKGIEIRQNNEGLFTNRNILAMLS